MPASPSPWAKAPAVTNTLNAVKRILFLMLESFWGYTIDFGANIEEDKASWYGCFITWRQMSSDVCF